jgi:molybdate transport system substrate-binding protein
MSVRHWSRWLLAAILLLAPVTAGAADMLVFAAASMKTALDEVNAAFTRQTGTAVRASYAATSALMRQIEQGAPADLFVSADLEWLHYGMERRLLRPDSRVDLLANRLVLIAPRDAPQAALEIRPGLDLATLIGTGRIVTGDVRSVPVGRYAKAALETLGLWPAIEPRLAMVENVRAALALVARGEAQIGIVYATDAQAEPNVKVIGTFPAESHPAVIYPVALTATAKPGSEAYLAFLRGETAGSIFVRHGFALLTKN